MPYIGWQNKEALMKKKTRKHRKPVYGIAATTISKDWGFIPVPGKGGNTTNSFIPEWMFKKELEEYEKGCAVNA